MNESSKSLLRQSRIFPHLVPDIYFHPRLTAFQTWTHMLRCRGLCSCSLRHHRKGPGNINLSKHQEFRPLSFPVCVQDLPLAFDSWAVPTTRSWAHTVIQHNLWQLLGGMDNQWSAGGVELPWWFARRGPGIKHKLKQRSRCIKTCSRCSFLDCVPITPWIWIFCESQSVIFSNVRCKMPQAPAHWAQPATTKSLIAASLLGAASKATAAVTQGALHPTWNVHKQASKLLKELFCASCYDMTVWIWWLSGISLAFCHSFMVQLCSTGAMAFTTSLCSKLSGAVPGITNCASLAHGAGRGDHSTFPRSRHFSTLKTSSFIFVQFVANRKVQTDCVDGYAAMLWFQANELADMTIQVGG